MGDGAQNTTGDESGLSQFIANPIVVFVSKLVFAVLLVIFLMLVAKLVASAAKRRVLGYAADKETKQVEQVANLVHDMVYYSLVIFAFFVGFQVLGFDVGLILGGVSLGVGLAFKEVLGNMIAGIMLLTNKDVRMGDIVQINVDGSSYFGRIEEINLRYSIVRTFELQQIVIPNMSLINATMQTFSVEKFIRLETMVYVDYDTDLDFATQVLIQAVNACQYVSLPEKTKIIVSQFTDHGAEMKCWFYIDPNSGLLVDQVIGLVNESIMNYCKANAILIPYPHTTLIMNWKDPVLREGIDELVMKAKPATQ